MAWASFGGTAPDTLLTEQIGLAALVFILAEGGLTTRWANVRPALGLGIALATVSVRCRIAVAGAGVQAACSARRLGLDWRTSLLWGAVLSSTDAAAVFSVLRGVGVKPRIAAALELESGLNDAPVVIAVLLLAGGTAHDLDRPAAGDLRAGGRRGDRGEPSDSPAPGGCAAARCRPPACTRWPPWL